MPEINVYDYQWITRKMLQIVPHYCTKGLVVCFWHVEKQHFINIIWKIWISWYLTFKSKNIVNASTCLLIGIHTWLYSIRTTKYCAKTRKPVIIFYKQEEISCTNTCVCFFVVFFSLHGILVDKFVFYRNISMFCIR